MSKQIEAMKLALEALKNCRENLFLKDYVEHIDLTITAMREALAEQPAQQEPVAWMNPHGGMLTANYIENFASGLDKEIHNIPLYTSPQPAPVQGWKLVPVQPTDEMRDAGNVIIGDRGALFAAYRAMLDAAPQAQPAREPTIYVDPDAIRILLDPDHSGVVTAQLTRHKPDPLRGPKVGLSITKGNT